MKGQKIKEILRAEGIALSDVASLLGYNSDQRLHSALKSDDVKSGLIEEIAKVTNKSIEFFYNPQNDVNAGETLATAPEWVVKLLKEKDDTIGNLREEIGRLRERLEQLQRETNTH